MPIDAPPCNLRDIRQLLNRVFDDPNLDAFCLDYFNEVYEQFSRGMQKQEKLTLLLRYHRSPSLFTVLLRVIYEYEHPDFKAFCAKKGIRFETVTSPEQITVPTTPSYLATQIHNFDMNELVIECLDHLYERQGLTGFVIPYNSSVFLQNFCERLKHEWGRSRIHLKPMLTIAPIHTSIEQVIFIINQSYIIPLEQGDVLFAVQISDGHQVEDFWDHLSRDIVRNPLPNRLIIIIGVHETIEPSIQNLITLRQPRFRQAHIHRWVRQIVETFAWPDDIAQRWIDQMIAECSYENELLVELVYDHLGVMLELLKQRPSSARFQEELERRRQSYV